MLLYENYCNKNDRQLKFEIDGFGRLVYLAYMQGDDEFDPCFGDEVHLRGFVQGILHARGIQNALEIPMIELLDIIHDAIWAHVGLVGEK